MKNYIVTFTPDGGRNFHVERVSAADYSKAYLKIIYKYLFENIIITDVKEA